MSNSLIIIASSLALLAFVHSLMGEKEILQPLFKAEWTQPGPRWAMERILRFAWHLTSLSWLGLAAASLGLSIHLAVAGVALLSAAIIFVSLRGHLAWPLFALAGFAALHAEGVLTAPVLSAMVGLTLLCVFTIAFLHIYWVAGGSWGISAAIPERKDGKPAFNPPPWLTACVALALLGFAGLILWTSLTTQTPFWARLLLMVAIAVMTLRAIGDGKQVGFSKTERNSSFSQWDDRLFTPLAVVMAFGSGAALLS